MLHSHAEGRSAMLAGIWPSLSHRSGGATGSWSASDQNTMNVSAGKAFTTLNSARLVVEPRYAKAYRASDRDEPHPLATDGGGHRGRATHR